MMRKILIFALLAVVCACSGIDKAEDTSLRLDLDNLIANVENGAEVADIAAIEREGVTVGYNVSFADGCGLTLLNQAEGSVVTALTEDSGNYYLDIEEGEKITLPKSKTKLFAVEITGDEVELADGGTVTATYKVTGATEGLEVSAMVGEGWKAEIAASSESEGTITVTAPDTLTADKVLVSFRDGSGKQITRALRITSKSSVKHGNIETYTFYGLNYYSIDPNQVDHDTALRRYKEAVDAGIQIMESSGLYWWTSYDWYEEALYALDLAQEAGLKLSLIIDRQIWNKKSLEHFINQVKDHPALWGYKIKDEPTADEYAMILEIRQIVEKVDGKHPCYVNLRPDGGTFGPNASYCTANYYEYVDRYIKETDPDFVSFDDYPCFPDWVLDKDWYSEFEILTSLSKAAGLDLWAFAATCRFSDGYGLRCKPYLDALRFQHYTNLMYGAQCLEYFVWGVVSLEGEVQTDMDAWPTNPAGDINTEDETYYAVKALNQEVQNRAFVFDGCEMKWVAFYKDVPDDCHEVDMTKLPEEIMSFSSGSDLVLSVDENDGGKSEYFCIKSRTHLRSVNVHLRFRYPVQTVERDGSLKSYNAGDYDFVIDPGDILIVKTK